MSRGWSKVYIGLGAGAILLGAVSLGIGFGQWSMHVGYILFGVFFVFDGITSILGVRDRKAIRGLGFGFGGVGFAFLVTGLVLLVRS